MFPVLFTFPLLRQKGKKETGKKLIGRKGKKICSHVNATITKGVILAAYEISSYPQQKPGICKLEFKISSAEVKSLETLHLISKGKGKNNHSVLLEQRCSETRVSQRNDRDAV